MTGYRRLFDTKWPLSPKEHRKYRRKFCIIKNMRNEKRQYDRHGLDFVLYIKGTSDQGHPFTEQTSLINISGGGAEFVSSCHHYYYKGQVLETQVILPETRDVKGCLETTATVTRLTRESRPDAPADDQKLKVAVCFKKNLELKRIPPLPLTITRKQGTQ